MVYTLTPSQNSSSNSATTTTTTTTDHNSPASSSAHDSPSELFFLLHITAATLTGSVEWRTRNDHIMLRLEASEVLARLVCSLNVMF